MIQTALSWSTFKASPIWPCSPSHPVNHHSPHVHLAQATLASSCCLKPALDRIRAWCCYPRTSSSKWPAGLIPSLHSGLCSYLPWSLRRSIIPSKMTEWAPFFHHFSSSIIFLRSTYLCLKLHVSYLLVYCHSSALDYKLHKGKAKASFPHWAVIESWHLNPPNLSFLLYTVGVMTVTSQRCREDWTI